MVKTVATQFIDQFPESAWLSQMKQMQDIIQSKGCQLIHLRHSLGEPYRKEQFTRSAK